MTPSLIRTLSLSALAIFGTARTSSAWPETATDARPYASRPAPAPERETLTDAQIATVALTAYQIDIDRNRMALRLARHGEVRRLAEATLAVHSNGKQDILLLISRLRLFPQDSRVMRSLGMDAARTDLELPRLRGAAFDRAFVNAEITYHRAWIVAVGHDLLPRVRSHDLRQALAATASALRERLADAQGVGALLQPLHSER